MLLADSHITMVVGVDVHVTTAPPFNPIHPYIGMVMDPADYIPFLGTNVSVNGLKRGVSDTGGMIIPLMHIPLAGPFAMASMIGHESMNFFASQTVFCDGSRTRARTSASRHRFRWNGAGHGTPIRSTRAGWAMAYTAAMTARWKVSRTRT